MKKIAIVGASGLVGQVLLEQLINGMKLPPDYFVLFASNKNTDTQQRCGERVFNLEKLSEEWLPKVDVWFFAAPAIVSQHWIPIILKNSSAVCIDGSCAFRLDDDVPLIIPEINGQELTGKERLIASPNCTTSIGLMPLWPLHKVFHLKRFWGHSYQAASGMGAGGVKELKAQLDAYNAGNVMQVHHFYRPLAFNAIPQIGPFDVDGNSEEERKFVMESRKILREDKIKIFANCVRVPVLRCHSIAISAEFARKLDLNVAKEILKHAPGIHFCENDYPTALEYSGKLKCGVGRLRYDDALDNGLAMWVVGDQLLKGAALNMLQIFQRWAELTHWSAE